MRILDGNKVLLPAVVDDEQVAATLPEQQVYLSLLAFANGKGLPAATPFQVRYYERQLTHSRESFCMICSTLANLLEGCVLVLSFRSCFGHYVLSVFPQTWHATGSRSYTDTAGRLQSHGNGVMGTLLT